MILTKHIKQVLTTVLFTLLGVALMVWIYRGFDFSPLGKVFAAGGNYLWIVLSLLVGIAANIFRSLRWRMLLAGAGIPIKRRRAIELVFISYLINSITPRLGELTRSLLVRRGDVALSAKAFGTVVIEKLADVACLLGVVVLSVVLRWEDTVQLVERSAAKMTSDVSSALLYLILGIIFLLALFFVWSKVDKLRLLLHNLWEGVLAILHLERPWGFVGLCIAIWICNFLQLYLLVPCFEEMATLDVVDAFYLFAAASIGVLLPTPGGAGPWHFAIVKTLTSVFAVNGTVAKLFALVSHGLKTALVMLLGLLAYLTFYWEIWYKAKQRRREKQHRLKS